MSQADLSTLDLCLAYECVTYKWKHVLGEVTAGKVSGQDEDLRLEREFLTELNDLRRKIDNIVAVRANLEEMKKP